MSGEANTCDCLSGANAKLAEHNAEIVVTWWPVTRPVIETQKVDSKKRGKPPLMVATYCPFCGAKYPAASS